MAIFYSRVKTIGAKQGSIVKAAAYRSGEKLSRDKTGEVANYRNKQGVIYSELIAPKDSWVKDRNQFWNAVEKKENRSNARYAKEIVLALPHELSPEQNILMMQDYIRDNFTSLGMVADLAIHIPNPNYGKDRGKRADARNIHAHILISDRPLTKDGFANKKDRRWNSKSLVEVWRESWATMLNHNFQDAGLKQVFDHRSYARQGSDFLPQKHEGKIATALRRKTKPVDKHQYSEIFYKINNNDLVKEYNKALVEIVREREAIERGEREPPDRTNKVIDLEHTERPSITTKNGSNGDAVEIPDTPKPTEQTKPTKGYDYVTNSAAERQAQIKPVSTYTNEYQAVRLNKLKAKYFKGSDRASAEQIYSERFARLTRKSDNADIARSYQQIDDKALDCDRLIYEYMRRRGFDRNTIINTMRRSSPAMYRKSVEAARRYARRFNDYARQKQQQKKERERREKQQQNIKRRHRNSRRL